MIAIGLVGFLIAVAFVRYRTAWALGNLLEYPVWLICGFLVPLTTSPPGCEKIAWVLPPTWGMNAIRESAEGGTPLPDCCVCVGLGLVYTAIGIWSSTYLLAPARARDAGAHMSSARLFFVGGLTSFRALFGWLSPWI